MAQLLSNVLGTRNLGFTGSSGVLPGFTATVIGSNGNSNWSGSEPAIATITVPGILVSDRPIISLNIAGKTFEDALFYQRIWNLVYRAEASANNEIKLYAIAEPYPDLDIIIDVMR